MNIRIGARVRSLRSKHKLTQQRLAELVGVTTETISNIERGVGTPGLRTLSEIAAKLDVSIAALLEFEKANTPVTRRRLDAEERLRGIVTSLGDDALEVLVEHAELVTRLQGRSAAAKRARS